jgi:hypothetical protein
MPIAVEQLWGAIHAIGGEDGTADNIAPKVVNKLIDLKFVKRDAAGLPMLTRYGWKAYTAMESGDDADEIPELHTPGGYG